MSTLEGSSEDGIIQDFTVWTQPAPSPSSPFMGPSPTLPIAWLSPEYLEFLPLILLLSPEVKERTGLLTFLGMPFDFVKKAHLSFLHICSSNRHHVGTFLPSGCFQTPRIQRQTSHAPALKELRVSPRAGRCRLHVCWCGQHDSVKGGWHLRRYVLLLNHKKKSLTGI